MDARAHGESGGDMATYGWKERHDTAAVTNALFSSEKVRHLYALGVSMGAAIALQFAAIELRIEAVAAEHTRKSSFFSHLQAALFSTCPVLI